MALNTTINGSISSIITGNAVCFRDPSWYDYSNSAEAFCEELIWRQEYEYLNMASSVVIGMLGFYQMTWENHNLSIIRFISALLIFCSVVSFLNHFHNTRTYMLLENFTMYLVEYMILSMVMEKYCRNIQILLPKEGIFKYKMTETQSQLFTGINWTFSTCCIYFLLYRDINGCEWGTWPYKLGYVLPIGIMLIFVGIFHFISRRYDIQIGTISHGKDIAKNAFNYFQAGTSLLFIGVFTWILMQSTCIENSGIEYIPAHCLWHLLFGYGFILILQYYIFIANDINGHRMILSQRSTNSFAILSVLFPYFMKYKSIFREETERMLNDIKPQNVARNVGVSHPNPMEIKDLRQSIETLNRERKARKLQQKFRKKQGKNTQRKVKYADFDVNDYMKNENEIQLQMTGTAQQTDNHSNDVEEEAFGVGTP